MPSKSSRQRPKSTQSTSTKPKPKAKPKPKSKRRPKATAPVPNNSGVNEHPEYTEQIEQSILSIFQSLQTCPAFPSVWLASLQSDIQTVKSHLYNRSFALAFSEPRLLRAYALRWSPTRALAYRELIQRELGAHWKLPAAAAAGRAAGTAAAAVASSKQSPAKPGTAPPRSAGPPPQTDPAPRLKIVCLGAGAGAELVALTQVFSAWSGVLGGGGGGGHEEDGLPPPHPPDELDEPDIDLRSVSPLPLPPPELSPPELHLLDSAPWAPALSALAGSMQLRFSGACLTTEGVAGGIAGGADSPAEGPAAAVEDTSSAATSTASIEAKDPASPPPPLPPPPPPPRPPPLLEARFTQADLLDLPTSAGLQARLAGARLVTLFFTLNELYAASRARTTGMLLALTDVLGAGAWLLVVDSPGDYATVDVGSGADLGRGAQPESAAEGARGDGSGEEQLRGEEAERDRPRTEKMYPMLWLLDHTLLQAASARVEVRSGEVDDSSRKGGVKIVPRWEKVYENKARWYRVPQAYGYPLELENMRYQAHLYRRI